MTDARRFASSYGAFWQSVAPSCELFVRRANLYGYVRWEAPLAAPKGTLRHSLYAEYAFSRFIFEHDPRFHSVRRSPDIDIHSRAWQEAVRRLSPYASHGLDLETPFSEAEKGDTAHLTKRLYRFFARELDNMTTRPHFPGCGYIERSEGDVLIGSTLYEIKAVDRMMRSIDFRQLLTYAALNKGANIFELKRVGVINPRRGICFECSLDEVCFGVSGNPAEVLLSEIIETISSGDISR